MTTGFTLGIETEVDPDDPAATMEIVNFGVVPKADRTEEGGPRRRTDMDRPVVLVLYVVAMVAVIVAEDVAFFRDFAWDRLIANVGTVLLFAAFYLRFLRSP